MDNSKALTVIIVVNVAVFLFAVMGCAAARLTSTGAMVRSVTGEEAERKRCQFLGIIQVQSRASWADVLTKARNEAAGLGGNAIVIVHSDVPHWPEAGTIQAETYSCPP